MRTQQMIFDRLQELGAGEFKHVNGSLIEHLQETADLLKSWGNREALCNAGLYHSVYGTAGYQPTLVDPAMRKEIADLIGAESEEITYLFSICDRKAFSVRVGTPAQLSFVDRNTGKPFEVSLAALKDHCELTLANELQILAINQESRRAYGRGFSGLFERMRGLVSDQGFAAYRKILGAYVPVDGKGSPRP